MSLFDLIFLIHVVFNESLKYLFNIIKKVISYIKVMDCLAGAQFACLNRGNCYNNNGVGGCQCPSEYTGTYFVTVLGCAAGGLLVLMGG